MKKDKNNIHVLQIIEDKILLIRGQRVMIDRDLAFLYGVKTKHLNRQIKRNRERFPNEFMFRLTTEEKNELVTNWHRFTSLKYSSVLPLAFTEHGVAMLATVLKSEVAIKTSIGIIKIFIKLKEYLSSNKELRKKLNELEMKIEKHDEDIKSIFQAIRQLIPSQENKPKRRIGFNMD